MFYDDEEEVTKIYTVDDLLYSKKSTDSQQMRDFFDDFQEDNDPTLLDLPHFHVHVNGHTYTEHAFADPCEDCQNGIMVELSGVTYDT